MYIDNITKKCNLDFDDSISAYNHWGAQQNYNSFEVFYNFITKEKPKKIIEIGTSLGGFTCFLKYVIDENNIDCHIITYDIINNVNYPHLKDMGIDVRIENIFFNDYTEISQYVIDFMNEEGKIIILCDGGNKIKEFNILSNFMKSGDFILAHDYAENGKIFQDKIYKKVWNWLEIQYSDIESAVNTNNLEVYNSNIFENIAWTCWKKK